MRRSLVYVMAVMAALTAIGRTQVSVLESTVLRQKAAPVPIEIPFTAPAATVGTLRLINGPEGERVSSALLLLNGVPVVQPAQLSQSVAGIAVPVSVLQGANSLRIELRSRPGAAIAVRIDVPVTLEMRLIGDPTSFLTNSATESRFQAEVEPVPGLDPSSVALVVVDENMQPVGTPLAPLRDNGQLLNGDDIAGDNVYSCLVTFNEPVPRTFGVAARATVGGVAVLSPALQVFAVDPLTQADALNISQAQTAARLAWQINLANLGDTAAARLATVTTILADPNVASAGVSEDGVTIWIRYTTGVHGGLVTNPPGTRGAQRPQRPGWDPPPPSRWSRTPARIPTSLGSSAASFGAPTATEVGNNRVMIWDAYNSQFSPHSEGPPLQALFGGSMCPPFDVTYLVDQQATVASVRSFTNFGTVALITHGAVDGDGQVVFLTREEATVPRMLLNAIDLILGRLDVLAISATEDVFGIRPSFIRALSGTFEDAVVYNGSCESSANATMNNAFFAKGAKAAFGFTRVVNSDYAKNVAIQLFTSMVTNLDNSADAFSAVSPKVDPTAPNATFTMAALTDLVYSGNFANGSFEEGLERWTTTGDGRVITALGEFSPTDGARVAIISTGLGFTTSSGSIEQEFCLPMDATMIQFNWNMCSEEFVEWCGPAHPFDDPFIVDIITQSGTFTLLSETVDTLCPSVMVSALFFDQSSPGCEPTKGVGVGTGGNDCTVWSTGWRMFSADISALAAANAGMPVTLRFRNFDAGDSIFDSAVLLDDIRVITP